MKFQSRLGSSAGQGEGYTADDESYDEEQAFQRALMASMEDVVSKAAQKEVDVRKKMDAKKAESLFLAKFRLGTSAGREADDGRYDEEQAFPQAQQRREDEAASCEAELREASGWWRVWVSL